MYSVHKHNFLVFTLLSVGPLKRRGPKLGDGLVGLCLNPTLETNTKATIGPEGARSHQLGAASRTELQPHWLQKVSEVLLSSFKSTEN